MISPFVLDDAATVGDSLRRWRLVLDMPAAIAAERADISLSTLRTIEKGEAHRVGFRAILSLSRVYGIHKQLLDAVEPLQTEVGVARASRMSRKRASR